MIRSKSITMGKKERVIIAIGLIISLLLLVRGIMYMAESEQLRNSSIYATHKGYPDGIRNVSLYLPSEFNYEVELTLSTPKRMDRTSIKGSISITNTETDEESSYHFDRTAIGSKGDDGSGFRAAPVHYSWQTGTLNTSLTIRVIVEVISVRPSLSTASLTIYQDRNRQREAELNGLGLFLIICGSPGLVVFVLFLPIFCFVVFIVLLQKVERSARK